MRFIIVLRLATVIGLCCIAANAQQATALTTLTPAVAEKRIDWQAKIVDSTTQAPLTGATVQLTASINFTNIDYSKLKIVQYAGQSDAKGLVTVQAPAGDYTMKVTLDGYGPDDRVIPRLTIKDTPVATPLTIRMVHGATVSGVVEDEEGKPVAGIFVELLDPTSVLRSLSPRKSTGADGTFSFPSIIPGTYYLRGSVLQALDIRVDRAAPQYAFTYYPDAREPAGAVPIQVLAGVDVPGLRIRMQKAALRTVSGRVLGRENNPVSAATVQLRLMDDPRIPMTTPPGQQPIQSSIAPDGTFKIVNVMPGSYTARIMPDLKLGKILFPLGGDTVTVENRDIDDLRLNVLGGGTLAGKLLFEDGTYHPGEWQFVVQGHNSGGEVGTPVVLSETGTFRIDGLTPGTYRLAPGGITRATVNQVDLGGAPREGNRFDFTLPGTDRAIVTLGTQGATIQGNIETGLTQGEVISGYASAFQAPINGDRWFTVFGGAALQPDGSFTIQGLEPGRYVVCAWFDQPSAVGSFLQSAALPLQRLEQKCKVVTLKVNESAQAQVKQTSIADVTR